MVDGGLLGVLSVGFGLGLLHALDADHIAAVSGLTSTRPGPRAGWAFCLRWSMGHGLMLLAIGGAVLLAGMAIPQEMSAYAEGLVGLVLLGIGAWVAIDLLRSRVHIHFHQHDGLPNHAHWHAHNDAASRHHRRAGHAHRHGAVLVGALHGLAGSAPLLALLPLASAGAPWVGLAYIGCFSVGVLVAMLLFGGVLGGLFGWLARWGERAVRLLRTGVATGSMGLGLYLLAGGG